MHVNKSERKLLPMSRIAPGRNDAAEIDTVVSAKRYGDRRAFDILMEAQYYWSQMDDFRKDRERKQTLYLWFPMGRYDLCGRKIHERGRIH